MPNYTNVTTESRYAIAYMAYLAFFLNDYVGDVIFFINECILCLFAFACK